MLNALLGLLLFAATGPRSGQSLDFGWQHEPGVLGRGLVTIAASVPLAARANLDAAAGFSMFQHQGIAAWGASVRLGVVPRWSLDARLAGQHEQWNDWRAGENRVIGTVRARPLDRLELEIGLAWRVPLFDPEEYWSPLAWSSTVPELNLVYWIDWRFLEGAGWDISLRAASFDGLHLRNPQQFGLTIAGRRRLDSDWRLFGEFGTAVNGISGPLVSAHALSARMGVEHGY